MTPERQAIIDNIAKLIGSPNPNPIASSDAVIGVLTQVFQLMDNIERIAASSEKLAVIAEERLVQEKFNAR